MQRMIMAWVVLAAALGMVALCCPASGGPPNLVFSSSASNDLYNTAVNTFGVSYDRYTNPIDAVTNAGAIFLGRFTPEAIGDYIAGPNHVLPTARSARFSSGLSVLDFMKRSSVIGCAPEGLAAIGPAAITLAEAEGLDAHALSIRIRLDSPSDA